MASTRKQGPPPTQPNPWQAVALLLAMLAAHLVANLVWLNADTRVAVDEIAVRDAQAVYYREALFGDDAGTLLNRLVRVGDVRPGNPPAPLLSLLGGVALELTGAWQDAAALTSTLALLLLLIAVYALARRVLDPPMAVLAAAITGLMPIIYTASRIFVPDVLTAALVFWALYAALRSEGFRRGGWAFLAGVLGGVALLAAPAAWIYLVPMVIVTAVMGLLAIAQDSQRGAADAAETGRLAINLLVAIVAGGGVAAPWFFRNAEALAKAADDVAAAEPERIVASDPLGLLLSWLATAVNEGVFLPLLVLALLGMIVALAAPALRKAASALLFFWPVLVLFLAIPYLGTPTARAIFPVLPALAIFAAMPVAMIPTPGARRGLAVLLVVALLFPYGNLSVAPYGDLKRVDIPLSAEETGDVLSVYRETIHLAPGVPPLGAVGGEGPRLAQAETVIEEAARQEVVRQEQVEQVEDTSEIDGLGSYDLFLLLRSEAFDGLSPTLQTHARDRFTALMSAFPADYAINDALSFVQADVLRLSPQAYEFRFSFRVDKAITKDWRMYLRGHVADSELHYLPPDYRAQGYIEWTTETNPPATQWEPGSFVILPLRVNAEPINYQFKVGFFDAAQGFFGRPVVLDIDLGTIPE